MLITQEGNNVRFQLVDQGRGIKLCDFIIEKEAYFILKDHIIEKLNNFKPK